MGLTIVGAALLIAGLLMVVVGETQRLKSRHAEPGILRMGEVLAVCGLAVGILLLVAVGVGRADRGRADRGRADRGRADRGRGGRGRARRLQAGRGERGKTRRPAAPVIGPRPDPADGWLSPPQGRAADWPHEPPAGRPRDPVGGWPGLPRDPAGGRSSLSRDPAEEWFGPLRTAGAGGLSQHAMRVRPESAEEHRPGSDDYADDGWRPDLGAGWDPGPAYVWNSGGEDGWTDGGQDWGAGGGQDWGAGGGQDWGAGGGQDRNLVPSRPSADARAPGPAGHEAAPGSGDTAGARPGCQDAPVPRRLAGPQPEPDSSPDVWPGSTQEKLNQIKDLYLTAEAIGEDALNKHFDQLSQRQRALIREYFERAGLRAAGAAAPLGGESAENGAPLPG